MIVALIKSRSIVYLTFRLYLLPGLRVVSNFDKKYKLCDRLCDQILEIGQLHQPIISSALSLIHQSQNLSQ